MAQSNFSSSLYCLKFPSRHWQRVVTSAIGRGSPPSESPPGFRSRENFPDQSVALNMTKPQTLLSEDPSHRVYCSDDGERESHHYRSGVVESRGGGTIPSSLHLLHTYNALVAMYNQQSHEVRPPSGKRLLSLWDRHSNLDGRPCFNPIKPSLETGKFIKAFEPRELVTSDPVSL